MIETITFFSGMIVGGGCGLLFVIFVFYTELGTPKDIHVKQDNAHRIIWTGAFLGGWLAVTFFCMKWH